MIYYLIIIRTGNYPCLSDIQHMVSIHDAHGRDVISYNDRMLRR